MLAKYWKKIGLLILIIACVFNVMGKLVNKVSLNKRIGIISNVCSAKIKKMKF